MYHGFRTASVMISNKFDYFLGSHHHLFKKIRNLTENGSNQPVYDSRIFLISLFLKSVMKSSLISSSGSHSSRFGNLTVIESIRLMYLFNFLGGFKRRFGDYEVVREGIYRNSIFTFCNVSLLLLKSLIFHILITILFS